MYDIEKRTNTNPPSAAVAYTVLVLGVAGMILCAVVHVWLGVLTTAVTLIVVMAIIARARSVHRPAAQTRIRIALDHGPATYVQQRADRVEQANRRLLARLHSTRRELAQANQDRAALQWQAAAAIGAAQALADRPAEVHNHVNVFGDSVAHEALDWFGQQQPAIQQRPARDIGQPDPDRQAIEERRR